MNANDIRALATEEIKSKMEDAREELFKLRFQLSTAQLTDSSRLRAIRRDVARLGTVLRERDIAAKLVAKEAK